LGCAGACAEFGSLEWCCGRRDRPSKERIADCALLKDHVDGAGHLLNLLGELRRELEVSSGGEKLRHHGVVGDLEGERLWVNLLETIAVLEGDGPAIHRCLAERDAGCGLAPGADRRGLELPGLGEA